MKKQMIQKKQEQSCNSQNISARITKIGQYIYNLVDCTDTYFTGSQLCGTLSKYWRYRVGDYRIVAEIDDENIIILIVKIGHRREIYN